MKSFLVLLCLCSAAIAGPPRQPSSGPGSFGYNGPPWVMTPNGPQVIIQPKPQIIPIKPKPPGYVKPITPEEVKHKRLDEEISTVEVQIENINRIVYKQGFYSAVFDIGGLTEAHWKYVADQYKSVGWLAKFEVIYNDHQVPSYYQLLIEPAKKVNPPTPDDVKHNPWFWLGRSIAEELPMDVRLFFRGLILHL